MCKMVKNVDVWYIFVKLEKVEVCCYCEDFKIYNLVYNYYIINFFYFFVNDINCLILCFF